MVEDQWLVIEQLGSVILANVKGCIFEIGIGHSTLVFKKFADEFKRDLYCFDQMQRKCEWAEKLGCKTFCGKSLKTMKKFPDIPVAMGLIDGRHDAKTVRQEVYFFLEKLSIGGIIFMHDTYLVNDNKIRDESHVRGPAGDMYKVRQELQAEKNLQVFTWPYTAGDCGLTMVLKEDSERGYQRR
jgi:hypothetical protein